MKRPLIVVQQQPYDWEAAKKQIEEITGHFAGYLSEYRSKRATGSKHAVLGPVGKLLNKAAAGERNPESLLGFTVRIHEMSSEGGYLSSEGLEHLRSGAAGLLILLASAPLSARDRIISQVDDGIYYLRRKGLYEYLESKRQEFVVFLQAKYDNDEEKFKAAWEDDAVAFDRVRYPGPYQRRTAKAAKAADIAEFWKSQKEEPIEDEEEIE
jgi:hypothetical protein